MQQQQQQQQQRTSGSMRPAWRLLLISGNEATLHHTFNELAHCMYLSTQCS
jgi:hypothetical protein